MQDKALHHLHKRKRIYKKFEIYPHPKKLKRIMDKLIYLIAILTPLMTLPQVYKIWIERNPVGVSALTWSSYLLAACFWLSYGILHKEKPIILVNVLMIILEIIIIIGVLTYG